MAETDFAKMSNFIRSIADLLRGPYRPNQYKDVMLPLTILRRLDCVLSNTKAAVLSRYEEIKDKGEGIIDLSLKEITDLPFYNTSRYDFDKLKADPDNIVNNLINYIQGFSKEAHSIFESFKFGYSTLSFQDVVYSLIRRKKKLHSYSTLSFQDVVY